MLKNYLPRLTLRQRQTKYIIAITFWSQFSVHALSAILILFLIRPFLTQGLGYSQAKAYAFIGISQAMNYLMPIMGGYMADNVLGIRRSILLGSFLLASAYLLIMLSGYTLNAYGDTLFIAAYALIPGANSLLIGTSSGLVSHIHANNAIKAKSAMTYYYMAINAGALLATIISPLLFESRYGPLSVLTIAFIGKMIAALNFWKHYALYDNVVSGKDEKALPLSTKYRFVLYLVAIYSFTLFAYSHILITSVLIMIGCVLGMLWFLVKTLALAGKMRTKQLIALVLILEAIVFFIIHNQMDSTLVLFARNNSNLYLFGLLVSPAQYKMINPLLIVLLGLQLPRFYRMFPLFSIPYQFACGILLASLSLFIIACVPPSPESGMVNGNYIALSYILITLAELWVSAIGLSMIGLYCSKRTLAFAMGVWYLACSLAHTLSGHIAKCAAIPEVITSPKESLAIYQHYYFIMACSAFLFGILTLVIAKYLHHYCSKKRIKLA